MVLPRYGNGKLSCYLPHPKDEGRYCFQLSVHTQGESGYLPWIREKFVPILDGGGVPTLDGEGVPTLNGGYLPWMGEGYLPWSKGGGTYLGAEGGGTYLEWGGSTYLEWGGYLPWVIYAMGSMPLVVSCRRTFLFQNGLYDLRHCSNEETVLHESRSCFVRAPFKTITERNLQKLYSDTIKPSINQSIKQIFSTFC